MAEALSTDALLFRKNLGLRIEHCSKTIGQKGKSAAICGVTPEQFNKWINGTVKVPAEALRLLAEAASADFSWLVTGEGRSPHARPIQIRRSGEDTGIIDQANGDMDDLDQPSFFRLPIYDVRASAGLGLPVGVEVQLGAVAFDRQFLRIQGARPDQCSIITASGDSMQPSIPDGSLLVVDHSQTEVKNGHIMAINVGDDLLVKRIRRRLDGMIELLSDNPAYPPETIAPDRLPQLRVVGRVVYFCRVP